MSSTETEAKDLAGNDEDLAGAGEGPFAVEVSPAQLRVWQGRPAASFLIRAVVLLAPILVAVAVTLLLIEVVPPPEDGAARVAWWFGMTMAALLVVIIADRVARRLLPLAALLKLSLVFPDQAPSRFRVALRTGTTRQLATRVQELREHGNDRRDVESAGAAELLALVAALNVHDHLTRGHSERVRALSDMIAEELGLPAEDRDRVRWAALLHDIGKLTIPAEILNKSGRPTAAEWRIIETHPAEGEQLIAGPLADWLGEWARAVGEHHERFDGRGYPRGLVGNEISLAGRLVAVADAFDVITSHRSYKRPLSADEARAEITSCAGTHFDPVVVRAFLAISVGRLRRTAGPLTWLAQIPVLGRALFFTPSVTPSVAPGLAASAATGAVAAVTAGVISLTPSLGLQSPATAAADASSPSRLTLSTPAAETTVPTETWIVIVGPGEVLAAPVQPLADALRPTSTIPAAAPMSTSPPASEAAPAPVAAPPVEPAPVDVVDSLIDAHAAHRATIREKLIAMHGDCMVAESPPPGGRKCGQGQAPPAAVTPPGAPATATPPAAPAQSHGAPDQPKVPPGQAKKG